MSSGGDCDGGVAINLEVGAVGGGSRADDINSNVESHFSEDGFNCGVTN